jgi:transcription factor SPN1
MSASPEHQAGSAAASPEPEKVATPIAADDDEAEQPADPVAEAGDNDDDENEGGISDDESILSEVDEAQFEDFNPENVDVEDRPQLAIDEENLKLIGRHKRKRTDDGEGRSRRKEGRREKKSRRAQHEDEGEDGSRRKERKKKEASPDTDEETLDPETREYYHWYRTIHWF